MGVKETITKVLDENHGVIVTPATIPLLTEILVGAIQTDLEADVLEALRNTTFEGEQ